VAGDAFCGNCGAFLEFAAEEAAEEAQAGVPVAPAGMPAAAPVPMTPPSPAPAAPVPAAAGSAASVPPSPSGPTCSACGRVNPAGRRFCISCGDRLPAASTVAQGPASATPPAALSSRPAWEFPTAPIPAAAASVAPAAAAPPSGARSRLPLIGGAVVVLALLAGGAVLVLGGGLGGGTPGTNASASPSSAPAATTPGAEPSAEPTTPLETPAASEGPSIPPEPTAAPATVPPGPSVGIAITAAKASSQLNSSRAPQRLYDGSPVTAWLSKVGEFDGSWVEVSFAAAAVTKIQIWTGWQKDEPLFYGNHRPHNVTVAFDGGVPEPLELKDVLGAQGVPIPPELGIVGATRLRITIIDTYPSRKTSATGSPSKAVAISEIRVFGVPAAP
ncbi:MAG: hypothetical protein ABIG85_08375, partial [Chloroflexota bacterium]